MADAPTVHVSGWGQNGARWLRPQSVAFTLLAEHVVPRGIALWSGSFIEAFVRVGITAHATRATLSRMVERDLLSRHRRGRRVYYSVTERCQKVIQDGHRRIWDVGAVKEDPGTEWTILTYSLPDSWQRERHGLRSRLLWAGFGWLHPGVWIAPTAAEVIEPLLDELDLRQHVHVFPVRPDPITDFARVVRETYDLEGLAQGYEGFIADWGDMPVDRPADDPLAVTLRLSTEWLELLHDNPRIPLSLLPEGWPAVRAQELFRTLHAANFPAATEVADELFEPLEDEEASRPA